MEILVPLEFEEDICMLPEDIDVEFDAGNSPFDDVDFMLLGH